MIVVKPDDAYALTCAESSNLDGARVFVETDEYIYPVSNNPIHGNDAKMMSCDRDGKIVKYPL